MSVSTITESLKELGLSQPESLEGTLPEYNAIDVFRNYIADELHRITQVDKSIVIKALDSSKVLEQGDIIVPIPKLRIKGINPNEKAKEWAESFNKGQFISNVNPQGVVLQFHFEKSVLYRLVIEDILKRKSDYGYLPLGLW